MKELVMWLVLMVPTQQCLDKDKRENHVKVVDPKTNAPMEIRIHGNMPPAERALILIKEDSDQPEVDNPEDCYDIWYKKITPQEGLKKLGKKKEVKKK